MSARGVTQRGAGVGAGGVGAAGVGAVGVNAAGAGRATLTQRIVLIAAGAIAVTLGLAIMFMPHAMHDGNGVDLGNNSSLLSEVRSPGGVLLLMGALILAGAFVPWLTFAATLAGAILYLGYGLGRVVSLVLDGVPSSTLVAATVVELVGGLALAWLLWRDWPARGGR